jgi:hypothetical protein
MKYRKLRIAWSVAWGLLAVLLCMLWVRSYWWHEQDWLNSTDNVLTGVGSVSGAIVVHWTRPGLGYYPRSDTSWFQWEQTAAYWRLTIPTPFLSFVSLICATLPWLHFRFGLRTLLIATTLVAVALGLVVWASR